MKTTSTPRLLTGAAPARDSTLSLAHGSRMIAFFQKKHPPAFAPADSPFRRSRAWFLTVLLTVASFAVLSQAAQAQYREYEVKAAFLSRFPEFVKWPAGALSDADAPFAIGILGDDPFGGSLDKLVKAKTVAGRTIVVRRGRHPEEVRSCQIVFISKSERGRNAQLVAALQGASILIVGETEEFTGQGGAIGFKMEGNQVRFAINSNAAQRAGLSLSSRLLKLARGTQ